MALAGAVALTFMKQRHRVVRTLYQRLLRLYPRSFREQFEASMVQTFDDLCNERLNHSGLHWGGLVS